MVGLQIVGGVLIVVATIWIVTTGTLWFYDRAELATAPFFDEGFRPISLARQKEVYEQRVAKQHRFFLRLRQGFPWSVGVLIVGIVLVIVGSH